MNSNCNSSNPREKGECSCNTEKVPGQLLKEVVPDERDSEKKLVTIRKPRRDVRTRSKISELSGQAEQPTRQMGTIMTIMQQQQATMQQQQGVDQQRQLFERSIVPAPAPVAAQPEAFVFGCPSPGSSNMVFNLRLRFQLVPVLK